MNEITNFFEEITSKKSDADFGESWSNIVYCFVELGWSQSDLEEAELPFLFDYLEVRRKVLKQREVENKKRRK